MLPSKYKYGFKLIDIIQQPLWNNLDILIHDTLVLRLRKLDEPTQKYPYQNGHTTGYIHTRNHEELCALAKQIDAMPKNQFIEHHGIRPTGSWKNDYIRYIDKEIERALLNTGIRLTIDGNEVEIHTEPGYYKYTDIKPRLWGQSPGA